MAAEESVPAPAPPSPPAPTAVTPSPSAPPPDAAAPAPPAAPPPTVTKASRRVAPEVFAFRARVADAVAVALVLAFAFLVASFPVTNSDFFLHAAAGRLIAHFDYTFGQDPFTVGSGGAYWANHAWLFDLLLYGLWSLDPRGIVVVVVKALLVAGLAEVLLRASRRPGCRLWVPAVCTALAVLTLSPRLFLQPVVVSYLLLAVTVWLLGRPLRQAEAGKPSSTRVWWLLPPLCALWVNLDQWFFLGPAAVALFLIGSYLEPRPAVNRKGQPRPDNPYPTLDAAALKTLARVLGACVLACFLSPHHYHAFEVPPQLGVGPAYEALHTDPQFQYVFASPVGSDWVYYRPYSGLSVAGLAVFALMLLVAVSFALNRQGPWRRRLVLVVPFAALALLHGRAIPFFAVVAGPVAALNCLDFAVRRFGTGVPTERAWRRWAVSGRALTIFGLVLLLVAAVPGWLQARPQVQRRVGYGVVVDESLVGAAELLAGLRRDGKLDSDAYFNNNPEVVNYFAWFCPGERGFLDQRLSLYDTGTARDYVGVRRALDDSGLGKKDVEPAWRRVFQDRGLKVAVMYEYAPGSRAAAGMGHMMANPNEWTLLYLSGRTAVFGWRGGPGQPRHDFAGLEVNMPRQAFGPDAAAAPRRGPDRQPEPREWYQDLWKAPPGRSLAADDAWLRYYYYTARRPYFQNRTLSAYVCSQATALVGTAALGVQPGGAGPLSTVCAGPGLYLDFDDLPRVFFDRQDDGPAALYLGLRSGRRATFAEPDDASAHFITAKTYQLLYYGTRERLWAAQPPLLYLLRRSQILAAAEQAAALDPDMESAHSLLADMYAEAGYLDLTVKHLKEVLRCAKASGPSPGETPDAYEQRVKRLELLLNGPAPGESRRNYEDALRRLAGSLRLTPKEFRQAPGMEGILKSRQDQFAITAANRPAVEQALMALDRIPGPQPFGLAEKALERLAEKKEIQEVEKNFSEAILSAQVQIDLLFDMGKVRDIQLGLTSELGEKLGPHRDLSVPAYAWYRVRLAAALGDYEEADRAFQDLLKETEKAIPPPKVQEQQASQEALLLARALLWETQPVGGPPALQRAILASLIRHENPNKQPALVDELLKWSGVPPEKKNETSLELGLGTLTSGELWAAALSNAQPILAPRIRQAELLTLRGWLALEAGAVGDARTHLRAAVNSRYKNGDGQGDPMFDFASRPLAETGLEWLKELDR
jgi:tetratricopeptide (TPR) repeat protein